MNKIGEKKGNVGKPRKNRKITQVCMVERGAGSVGRSYFSHVFVFPKNQDYHFLFIIF